MNTGIFYHSAFVEGVDTVTSTDISNSNYDQLSLMWKKNLWQNSCRTVNYIAYAMWLSH